MIQILPRVNHTGLYGVPGPWFYSVTGGLGASSLSDTYGPDYAKHPWSVAGTFRHLVVSCAVAHPTFTVTLVVNGVATALAATLDTAATLATDGGQTVTVVAGDDVSYQISGASLAIPGLGHHGTCVEFEGAACSYGITPGQESAPAAGSAVIGGALGNGEFSHYAGQPLSAHYSICAVAGTITRLDAKAYSGAPGAGGWVAQLRKNTVTQDGTGGTVDTTCTITGSATQAVRMFSLPVALGDRLDVLLARTGTTAPSALAHVACSVALAPTVAGAFMLCGGSNDAVRSTAPDWKWTRADQLVTTEALAEAPVGPAGFHATGLYVRRVGAPTPGRSTVYTLRRSGVDTGISLTIAENAVEGQTTGGADFASGERVTLQATPVNTPIQNDFYWGLALGPPPPPSYTVDERLVRRLRRAPHVAQEHTRVFYRRFELDLERGQGLATGQGSDPMVLLRISRDGGQTWGEEIRMAAGHLGEYSARVLARRLGQARDTVFEVVVSDPIAWSLVGAWLDLEPGTS